MQRNFKKFALPVTLAALAAGMLGIAGCSNKDMEARYAAEQAKIEQQQKNPEIKVIGVYDGCEVKYVDRYYAHDSFYIARCGQTTTTTTTVQVGKVQQNRMAITQQLETVSAQHEKLKSELEVLDKREAALAKLTPEERAALGIEDEKKKQASKPAN
jgi:hypothetical protein